MKRKAYISVPITGYDIEYVRQRTQRASVVLEKMGYEAVSPLEVSPDPKSTYAEHMGKDIQALLECDAIYVMEGFNQSKGCMLELYAALTYNKEVMYEKVFDYYGR